MATLYLHLVQEYDLLLRTGVNEDLATARSWLDELKNTLKSPGAKNTCFSIFFKAALGQCAYFLGGRAGGLLIALKA